MECGIFFLIKQNTKGLSSQHMKKIVFTSFLRPRSGKGHFLLSKSSSFVLLFNLKMGLLMSTLSFQKVKW